MAMRAIFVKAAATWSGEPADCVVLDYDDRHRRRVSMQGKKGLPFLLDLPHAARLHGGDALVLEDGRLIEVIAASEPLLEIHCADALQTARIAWHLGNRHVPTQVLAMALRVRRDHVIAEMASHLGADVVEIQAPFDPERGAYAHLHQESHDHGR
jgi:urease accessory protein